MSSSEAAVDCRNAFRSSWSDSAVSAVDSQQNNSTFPPQTASDSSPSLSHLPAAQMHFPLSPSPAAMHKPSLRLTLSDYSSCTILPSSFPRSLIRPDSCPVVRRYSVVRSQSRRKGRKWIERNIEILSAFVGESPDRIDARPGDPVPVEQGAAASDGANRREWK